MPKRRVVAPFHTQSKGPGWGRLMAVVPAPCSELSSQTMEQDVPGAALPQAVLRQDGLRQPPVPLSLAEGRIAAGRITGLRQRGTRPSRPSGGADARRDHYARRRPRWGFVPYGRARPRPPRGVCWSVPRPSLGSSTGTHAALTCATLRHALNPDLFRFGTASRPDAGKESWRTPLPASELVTVHCRTSGIARGSSSAQVR